jgi:hypothetical protein
MLGESEAAVAAPVSHTHTHTHTHTECAARELAHIFQALQQTAAAESQRARASERRQPTQHHVGRFIELSKLFALRCWLAAAACLPAISAAAAAPPIAPPANKWLLAGKVSELIWHRGRADTTR